MTILSRSLVRLRPLQNAKQLAWLIVTPMCLPYLAGHYASRTPGSRDAVWLLSMRRSGYRIKTCTLYPAAFLGLLLPPAAILFVITSFVLHRPPVACASDADCSYNGICQSKLCKCDTAWKGDRCQTLALLPTTRSAGLRSVDDGRNTSSWGGSVILDRSTVSAVESLADDGVTSITPHDVSSVDESIQCG
jgi:hypothetical protein